MYNINEITVFISHCCNYVSCICLASCDPQPLLSGDYSVLDDVIKATSQRDTIHGSPSSRIYPGSKGTRYLYFCRKKYCRKKVHVLMCEVNLVLINK